MSYNPNTTQFIPLSNGGFTVVDSFIANEVKKYNWYKGSWGYACRQRLLAEGCGSGKSQQLAHFVWEMVTGEPVPASMELDHKDCDKLNNSFSNLRLATHQQNMRNKKKWPNKLSSKYKGVSWCKWTGKWRATITPCPGKQISLGRFTSEEEAAKAYDAAAKQHFAEFAVVNLN